MLLYTLFRFLSLSLALSIVCLFVVSSSFPFLPGLYNNDCLLCFQRISSFLSDEDNLRTKRIARVCFHRPESHIYYMQAQVEILKEERNNNKKKEPYKKKKKKKQKD